MPDSAKLINSIHVLMAGHCTLIIDTDLNETDILIFFLIHIKDLYGLISTQCSVINNKKSV